MLRKNSKTYFCVMVQLCLEKIIKDIRKRLGSNSIIAFSHLYHEAGVRREEKRRDGKRKKREKKKRREKKRKEGKIRKKRKAKGAEENDCKRVQKKREEKRNEKRRGDVGKKRREEMK